jgi:hypothetical protein
MSEGGREMEREGEGEGERESKERERETCGEVERGGAHSVFGVAAKAPSAAKSTARPRL